MNPLFVDALQEIRKAGVELSIPGDLDAINRLKYLSDRARAESGTDLTAAMLRPTYRVGNVTLHRLTIAAEVFLTDRVGMWYETASAAEYDMAVAFVLAMVPHFETAVQPHYDDRAGFETAVRTWRRKINVTRSELSGALAAFAEMERHHVASPGSPTPAREYGPMIEMLVREYGKTAREWLFETPAVEIETLLGTREARAIAHGLQESKGKGAPDPMRPDLRAFRDFRKCVDDLKGRKP